LAVKLQYRNEKQYVITLPKAIVKAKKWKKGDRLDISLDQSGCLLLTKSKEGSIIQYNTQFILTLPKSLIEALGWSKNDTLEVSLLKNSLKLRRMEDG
jgi:bifunctional DNA-binding transcriptional regulator/antitoxin component of YhaV-PrlF toxin-antitoxin module